MEIVITIRIDYICNMKDRIKKLLLDEGLTSGSFADEIGVQRSSLSHILNGRNNPSLDFVIKTKNRFPKLNLSWLLLGEGDMYLSENENIKTERPLPPSSGSLFKGMLDEPKTEKAAPDIKEPYFQRDRVDIVSPEVDQIVIFYSDHSFTTYMPKKKD